MTPEPMFPCKPNPFDRLRNHNTMAAINAVMVPWLIAERGIYFGATDADNLNLETAMEMMPKIVMSKQLSCFTEHTYSMAVDGHRVEQVGFTKFVVRTASKYSGLLLRNDGPLTPFF